MKLFEKKDLKFINNLIVTEDGDIVTVEGRVFAQAASLDLMAQKANWIDQQPKACEGPDISKFKRSGRNVFKHEVHVDETPALDEAVEKAKALIEDLDKVDGAKRRDKLCDRFTTLMEWCDDDYVVGYVNGEHTQSWDFPAIENPLTMTVKDVFDIVDYICSVEEDM